MGKGSHMENTVIETKLHPASAKSNKSAWKVLTGQKSTDDYFSNGDVCAINRRRLYLPPPNNAVGITILYEYYGSL